VAPGVVGAAHERAGLNVAIFCSSIISISRRSEKISDASADSRGSRLHHDSLLLSPSDEPEASLPGAVSDVGDLDQIIGDDSIDDPVGIFRGQERAITIKGIKHGRSHFGKVAQKFELGNDLVLNSN